MIKKIYLKAFLIVIVDFLVKLFVLNNISNIEIIPNFFYLTLAKNTGAAFSIFNGYTYIFVIIAIIALIYISKNFIKENNNKLQFISYTLLIGGIIGNLINRVIYGYVIDYFRFIIFNYNFPIFNIADICITVGAFLLILDLLRSEKSENRSSR